MNTVNSGESTPWTNVRCAASYNNGGKKKKSDNNELIHMNKKKGSRSCDKFCPS